MRGAAAGALTATLAVAAHASAGGGLPSGVSATVLALLAATIGLLVGSVGEAADVKVLAALLALGQVLGHGVLGATGHAHAATGASWELMLAAHVAAVLVGAGLIAVGGYLGSTVSHVLHAAVALPGRRVVPRAQPVVGSADQPLRSALLLEASRSYRGPPVGSAR